MKILFILFISVLAFAKVGEVLIVKGNALIERSEMSIKAKNNMDLYRKDIVQTKDGRLQMHFMDNTVISLGTESRFVIKEYIYNDATKASAATFKIEIGFVKTITGAIGKMIPEMFVLETSSASIQPHGTIWSVNVDKNSERFEVQEGEIVISFKDLNQQEIELRAGEALDVQLDSKNNNKILKTTKEAINKELETDKKSSIERTIDNAGAQNKEEMNIHKGTRISADGTLIVNDNLDDGNNGHGNDPDGVDPSNPGKSKK